MSSEIAQQSIAPVLERARLGDEGARRRLFEVLYADLRARASEFMRRAESDSTLQPTALVHEAYLKLVRPGGPPCADRAHFMALASRSMRQVLVDHARSRGSIKRTPPGKQEPLDFVIGHYEQRSGDLEQLDDALEELAERDDDMARAVDLRFFGGLSAKETAAILGLSERTFERRWRAVKAWLYARLR